MEIVLITVGKTNVDFVRKGIDEYKRRLSHYIPFRIEELPDIKNVKSATESQQKEKEGGLILGKLSSSDFVVLLDEKGREYTSVEFSAYIQKLIATGRKRLVFVIGGPYGFCRSVYDRADAKLSLSRMTFNHEMVRMFFVEQIYRAMTILRGEPYHHE